MEATNDFFSRYIHRREIWREGKAKVLEIRHRRDKIQRELLPRRNFAINEFADQVAC